MNPKKSNNEKDNLKQRLWFYRFLNLCLICILFLSLLIIGFLVLRQVTVILPAESNRRYELGMGHVNKDYLLDMAEYVLNRVLTVTPENVDHNNKIILKMTDPSVYPDLKTFLDASALRLKRDRITTVWIPKKEEINEDLRQVKIYGRLKTYVTDKLTSE